MKRVHPIRLAVLLVVGLLLFEGMTPRVYASGVGKIESVCRGLLEDLGVTSGGSYSGAGGAGVSLSADPLLLDDGAGNQTYLSQQGTDGYASLGNADGTQNGVLFLRGLQSGDSDWQLFLGVHKLASDYVFQWSSTAAYSGTADLYLRRSAASTLTVDADGAGGAATLAVNTLSSSSVGTTNVTTTNVYTQNLLPNGVSEITANSQIDWTTGLGAITHLLGPSDQEFSIAAGTGRSLRLASSSADDLYLDARGQNKIRVSASAITYTAQSFQRGGASGVSAVDWAGNQATTLTESSATTVFNVLMVADTVFSGLAHINTYATDGTDDQIRAGLYHVTLKNDGGTVSGTATTVNEQAETSSGTLTHTVTVADGGGGLALIQVNAVSSLTQTTLNAQAHVVSGSYLRGGTTSIGNP